MHIYIYIHLYVYIHPYDTLTKCLLGLFIMQSISVVISLSLSVWGFLPMFLFPSSSCSYLVFWRGMLLSMRSNITCFPFFCITITLMGSQTWNHLRFQSKTSARQIFDPPSKGPNSGDEGGRWIPPTRRVAGTTWGLMFLRPHHQKVDVFLEVGWEGQRYWPKNWGVRINNARMLEMMNCSARILMIVWRCRVFKNLWTRVFGFSKPRKNNRDLG